VGDVFIAGVAIGLLVLCLARPLSAQQCVGDCRGVGQVGVVDLVLAVNILLGIAAPEQCSALGAPPIGISRLVLAVNNALCACQACPTPRSTSTRTPTPTPTATTGDTVTMWREDNFNLSSSNCPAQVTQNIRNQLAGASATYTVRQRGMDLMFEDGMGGSDTGTIDPDGTAHVTETGSQQQGACVVTVQLDLTVNLRMSPTTATYAASASTRSCPTNFDCSLQLTSRWTNISGMRRSRTSLREALLSAIASP
jgi:hypothetical protein